MYCAVLSLYLVLVEGSPGLVSPQFGGESEGAVLRDVSSGGGAALPVPLNADVVGRAVLHQHALTAGHLHPVEGGGRGDYQIKV